MRWTTLIILGLAASLSGCTPAAPTYADVQRTAVVAGCWPGNYPTPRPLPAPSGATATSAPLPNQPTRTAGPTLTTTSTATARVRCTPVPGAPTLIPWPTARPTLPPYPTRDAHPINGGSGLETLLELPGVLHHVALAVHPTQGWPAVATVQTSWAGRDDQRRIFVRVYQPQGHTWSIARQVNPDEAGNGNYGGVALAISGDGTVHVAWGGGFVPGNPVYYAASHDGGASWSTPQVIAQHCYHVVRLAATLDGQLALLALCDFGETQFATHPGLIIRRADGRWQPQLDIAVPGRWGDLVLLGDGATARVVILMSKATGQPNDHAAAWIITHALADAAPPVVRFRDLTPPPGLFPATASYELFGSLAFQRPDGRTAIALTWSVYGGNAIFAVTSLDGGTTWGALETVVANPVPSAARTSQPLDHRWSSLAYAPTADRLIVFWLGRDVEQASPQLATHYASWSVPGSGHWHPELGPAVYEQEIPLVTGARSATDSASAQAGNASLSWLAWIDDTYATLKVRSYDLNLIIPPTEYPTATPTLHAGG